MHDSTKRLQYGIQRSSNMAVSMSYYTCVFKTVTGNVYEMMVNFKANKSTQIGAQR